jgi:hypothetical protein
MGSERAFRPVQLNLAHYGVLALGLALLLTLAYCTLNSEALHFYQCRYSYLPSVAKRYGFGVGDVGVGDDGVRLGLVEVDPTGILGKASVRSGDIPMAHHGGFTEFCAAVQESASGRESFELVVINAAECKNGTRRRLRVPAVSPTK